MDTKSIAEKILREMAHLDGFGDVKKVCQAYLDQCQEVERLKGIYKSCVQQRRELRVALKEARHETNKTA